jgi:hypothetical protein
LGEPEPYGLGACLGPRADVELAEDRRNVVVNRPLGDKETIGDLGVAQAAGDEVQHFRLARREPRRVGARRRTRAACETASTTFAQAARHDRGRRLRTEALECVETAAKGDLVVSLRERKGSLVWAPAP